MKRRNFLKAAGAASVLLSAGTLYANNFLSGTDVKMFSPEELKASLEKHFDEILSGKNFNPDVLPPNGKFMIVKSYSIEINTQKNSIFDIADLVIERLKKSGFDARSLKNYEMPDDLVIGNGIVHIPNQMFPIKIDALRNYDATVRLLNTLSVATSILPKDWIKLTDYKREQYPNGVNIFKCKMGDSDFSLSGKAGVDKYTEYRINIEAIEPIVKISDRLPNLISFEFFSSYFTKEQAEQFNI